MLNRYLQPDIARANWNKYIPPEHGHAKISSEAMTMTKIYTDWFLCQSLA